MAKRLFEEFNSNDGDIETYIDRLEQYFIAMDLEEKEEEKKRKGDSDNKSRNRHLQNDTRFELPSKSTR